MAAPSIQKQIFAGYASLNLQDKLYQVKALQLAEKYLPPHTKPVSLLDVGCADGGFAQYAGRRLGAKTYGIDIAPKSIRIAKTKLDYARQHDVDRKLPFPDKTFQIVFALEVIEHIYDTDYFLAEIRRVLKPSGILILSTPNLASLKNRIRLLFNYYPQYLEYSTTGAGHIHLYTSKILTSQLGLHNYRIKELTAANWPAPFVTHPRAPEIYRRYMMRMGDWLPSMGSHLLVAASA